MCVMIAVAFALRTSGLVSVSGVYLGYQLRDS